MQFRTGRFSIRTVVLLRICKVLLYDAARRNVVIEPKVPGARAGEGGDQAAMLRVRYSFIHNREKCRAELDTRESCR